MKYITCSLFEQRKIECERHVIEDKKRIKFAKKGTRVIEYITRNKTKLTENLYALADEIYLTQDGGKHFAYAMPNYANKTLKEKISEINKREVLLTVNQIVNELLAIDVVYWDIHCCNFLSNGEKVIAIDLDEAKLGIELGKIYDCRYNFIDLMIHLYFGEALENNINFFDAFMNYFTIEKYFSKDVCDYLKDINDSKGEQLNRDPTFLIDEFEDREKIEHLHLKL